jgi:hypothetical protein
LPVEGIAALRFKGIDDRRYPSLAQRSSQRSRGIPNVAVEYRTVFATVVARSLDLGANQLDAEPAREVGDEDSHSARKKISW